MMLNMSPSRRLLITNLAAALACSIFSPLMLPERSMANTTVLLGTLLVLGHFDLRAGQQQEITVFVRLGPVAEHVRADDAGADVVEQAKIFRGHCVLGGVRDRGVFVVGPLDIDRMAWAVDVLDQRLAFDRQLELDLLDRLRRVLGRGQREDEIGQAIPLAAELRVAQRDFSFLARRHREHAGFEHAGADPFQQGRIAVLADDVFVHSAGFFGLEQLGGHFLAIDQERQLVDRAVVRQRKHEADFHRTLPVFTND